MNLQQYFNGGATIKHRPRDGATSQGFPVVGGRLQPNMRGSEFEEMPISLDVKVRIFDLSVEEQRIEYESVIDHIANRAWFKIDKTKMVSPDGQKIKIHLEWAEPKGHVVNGPRG